MGDILIKLICCGEEVKDPVIYKQIEILHVKADILIEDELKSALHNYYLKNK
jgi:hypothetical protein